MPERSRNLRPEDLDRIRQAACVHLREYFDGSPTGMRVVVTTHHAAKMAIQLGPGSRTLAPDPRPVYLVVVEGELRRRSDRREGCWLAIYVSPSFEAHSHSGPVPSGHPLTDRVISLDLSELGRVYEITL